MPRRLAVLAVGLFAASLFAAPLFAQQPLPPDVQADALVNAGRKAYADGNLPAARDRFQETVTKFGTTPAATSARYGLALTLVANPSPDYAKAADLLAGPAADGGFADRGQAAYLLGVCHRAVGLKEPDKAAVARFDKARQAFAVARDVAQKQADADLAARCRCDGAEMELRLGKPQDARNTCEPFAKDPALTKTKSHKLGLYYHGLACFLLKDYQAAGRSLNQVAPFADPAFGPHAEYLVGRVMHLSGEAAEASVHYDAVLAGYDTAKKAAAEALKNVDRFKANPAEKARLEALVKAAPEYVAAAAFHGATLDYEAGKFADALPKFDAFAKDYPASPLHFDALLRAGFCLVQLKQPEEAGKRLVPLVETPRLADQALLWLGKAQVQKFQAGQADALKAGTEFFKRAADYAQKLGTPDSQARRHDALLELADARQLAKEFQPAAEAYEQLWNDPRALPARREELLCRLACAWGLAGKPDQSARRVAEFRKTYPDSTLTPAVLLRSAEDGLAKAVELGRQRARPEAVQASFAEALTKFKEVADKYPEFERASAARFGQGMCAAQLGNLAEAVAALEAIPPQERVGDLAAAGYLLADCLVRQAPFTADDALRENQVREKLTAAAGLLETFLAASPKATEAPAALLKLAHCTKRLGATLADANERNQTLNRARELLDRFGQDYPRDPLAGEARLERAKIKALAGDRGGAMGDLRAFVDDAALQKSPAAPLAVLQLAALHREDNRPADAERVLADARKRYETASSGDPDRADIVGLLKYHHAVTLAEAGKGADALPLFDQVFRQAGGKPLAAEAALRSGQVQVADARKHLDAGRQQVQQAGADDKKKAAARQALDKARNALKTAAEGLTRRADELKNRLPESESRARLYYESAWAWRAVAAATDPEKEGVKPPPAAGLAQARAAYEQVVDQFKDLAVAVDARLELAELIADAGDATAAVKLLKDALDAEPTDKPTSADTLDRVRLRLGAALAAAGDPAGASAQFDAVASNPKSPHLAQALYRAGEARLAANDFAGAADKLKIFRDKPDFHNRDGVSDRAMLRLGQALVGLKQYDPARQAFETLLQRFGPQNALAPDARYGLGSVLFAQQKYDEAAKAFEAVTAASQREIAAQAQLQLGQCRFAQKKYAAAAGAFLAVPYTYPAFPEVGYAARLEAARAHAADGKPAEAEAVLKKLVEDAPAGGSWAKAAAERLKKTGK